MGLWARFSVASAGRHGLSRTTSRKLGRRWPPVPRAPACVRRAVRQRPPQTHGGDVFRQALQSFRGACRRIPGCGRRLVAIARMHRSTELARSSVPEIFLQSATRTLMAPGQRQRPPAMRKQTALARKVCSISRWASDHRHAKLVIFRGPRPIASSSFRRTRCPSSENSSAGGRGGGTGPAIARCRAAWSNLRTESIRVVMFLQTGVVGRRASQSPNPAGLPACPASETPPARCWWKHLDPFSAPDSQRPFGCRAHWGVQRPRSAVSTRSR